MSLLALVAVIVAGAVAGGLGSLLGIGGGVFLVPFLNAGLGVDFRVAAATGLMTVIATSSVVSAGRAGRHLINLRLGMLLEIATTIGGLIAAMTVARLSSHTLNLIFAIVTTAIAILMLSRLDSRNVMEASASPGALGGRFHDDDTGRDVVYQVRRLPLGMSASFVAGYVSGTLGIGGGILKVPVLNAWCGVPMRAAAATSALMIGVTAAASAPQYFSRGEVNPPLAAAAVIGVLIGSRAGLHAGSRARVRWLKMLMAIVLAAVSVLYFRKAFV
ncbi:MAG TPA: sulfite exporter TauE/SafE family protein [Vicinamibacterales bacterium]|jgi:hypothetical protein